MLEDSQMSVFSSFQPVIFVLIFFANGRTDSFFEKKYPQNYGGG